MRGQDLLDQRGPRARHPDHEDRGLARVAAARVAAARVAAARVDARGGGAQDALDQPVALVGIVARAAQGVAAREVSEGAVELPAAVEGRAQREAQRGLLAARQGRRVDETLERSRVAQPADVREPAPRGGRRGRAARGQSEDLLGTVGVTLALEHATEQDVGRVVGRVAGQHGPQRRARRRAAAARAPG